MRNRMTWLAALGNLTVFAAGLMLGATTIPGCSGKSNSADSSDSGGPKSVSGRRTGSSAPQAGGGDRGRENVTGNHRGAPVGGSHAGQVWYPNALAVALDERPVGTTETGKTNSPAGRGKVAKKKNPGTSASGDWKSVAPIAVLAAETKRIRNAVTGKMQTVGRYNFGYKEIQSNGATLAAIAQIVSQHPDSLSWKADAEYVRDLGTKLSEKANGLGRKKYDATKASFEAFVDILNRSKPKGLPKPEKEMTFSKCADRGGLMKRMEVAHKFLEKEVRDKKTFSEEAEKINHEATILATLSKVIADSSYESSDEADYKKYAEELIKASREMVAAVKTKSFDGYRKAVDRVVNQCNNCHSDYR